MERDPICMRETPTEDPDTPPDDPDTPPDGSYIFVCFVHTFVDQFWMDLWAASWGSLRTTLKGSSLSAVSFVAVSFGGSLGPASGPAIRIRVIGIARRLGCLGSLWVILRIVELFFSYGISAFTGSALYNTLYNGIVVLRFKRRLGLASSLVKFWGSFGAVVGYLTEGVLPGGFRIAWVFRLLGIPTLVTRQPTAVLPKYPVGPSEMPVKWHVFAAGCFSWDFPYGAVGFFPLHATTLFLLYIHNAPAFWYCMSVANPDRLCVR
ncbi:hypothetical protein CEK25_012548 [Fusarium fujikuroi]|nr:hypothetical protein CEK25_012548 [Fusarium fujikuroi]